MSHVVSSKATVTDLDCLEAALAKHFPKLKLIRDKKRFGWFGKWVKDYHGADAAYKNGVRPEDFGKCDHVIQLEGCGYEIGLCKVEGKQGWTCVWDFWGQGRQLSDAVGTSAEKLMNAYGKEFCARFAESIGASLTTEEVGDETVIEIEVNQ